MTDTFQIALSKEHLAIIRSVLYFDVFKYPLTVDELYENCEVDIAREKFPELLELLFQKGMLQLKSGYVLASERNQTDILNRLAGNKGAIDIMPTAYEYTQKIASFPFVEGVCLSGALSKNYYDDKGDIDFFIITKPGRLWICRTLLILRYKLLPEKKKKFWCTNYFISSEDLTIPDKNLFTATELAYLIPAFNFDAYKKLVEANAWYNVSFPNKQLATDGFCIKVPRRVIGSFIERMLNGNFGNWIDNKLLFMTLKHWRKRYTEMAAEDFELQFRARKTVSKRHSKGFQNKVLTVWQEKKINYEKMFGVSLG